MRAKKSIIKEQDGGWIKLHRKIMDNPMYFSEPFTRTQAWIDLILLANHTNNFFYIRGNKVDVARGQVGYSKEILSRRWGWSRGKTTRFIKQLETDGMLIQQKSSVTTLISICNYKTYQGDDTTDDTTDGHQTDINKNDKNDKNIDSYSNNLYRSNEVYSFDEFWNDYDKKVGDKTKLKVKWSKISNADKLKIKAHISEYKKAQPDKSYRKNPETYLNNKSWNDEIIKKMSLTAAEQPVKRYRTLDIELNDNFIE